MKTMKMVVFPAFERETLCLVLLLVHKIWYDFYNCAYLYNYLLVQRDSVVFYLSNC